MSNQLKMAQVQLILALNGRGWSQRRIDRELGVNRETVARYVELAAANPAKAADRHRPRGRVCSGVKTPAKLPTRSEALLWAGS